MSENSTTHDNGAALLPPIVPSQAVARIICEEIHSLLGVSYTPQHIYTLHKAGYDVDPNNSAVGIINRVKGSEAAIIRAFERVRIEITEPPRRGRRPKQHYGASANQAVQPNGSEPLDPRMFLPAEPGCAVRQSRSMQEDVRAAEEVSAIYTAAERALSHVDQSSPEYGFISAARHMLVCAMATLASSPRDARLMREIVWRQTALAQSDIWRAMALNTQPHVMVNDGYVDIDDSDDVIGQSYEDEADGEEV